MTRLRASCPACGSLLGFENTPEGVRERVEQRDRIHPRLYCEWVRADSSAARVNRVRRGGE